MIDQRGFTLVEMMVALFVFAILSSGAVMLLRGSVEAELASRERIDELAAMRRFSALWNADFGQAVARTARDEAGIRHPAFETGPGLPEDVLVRFTRSGWTNHDGAARPSLQKLDYRLADGNLVRRGHGFPDGAAPEPGAIVLEGVTAIRLRYRAPDGNWSNEWRPTIAEALPVAIEAVIERDGQPPLRILSLVGSAYQ